MTPLIPVSVGELVDKITILEIKKENFTDKEKLKNVERELNDLRSTLKTLELPDTFNLFYQLYEVNKKLWVIEDNIRQKESVKEFDEEFIELARSVYYTNDVRASLKKELNILVGSTLIEEKQYDEYAEV